MEGHVFISNGKAAATNGVWNSFVSDEEAAIADLGSSKKEIERYLSTALPRGDNAHRRVLVQLDDVVAGLYVLIVTGRQGLHSLSDWQVIGMANKFVRDRGLPMRQAFISPMLFSLNKYAKAFMQKSRGHGIGPIVNDVYIKAARRLSEQLFS